MAASDSRAHGLVPAAVNLESQPGSGGRSASRRGASQGPSRVLLNQEADRRPASRDSACRSASLG